MALDPTRFGPINQIVLPVGRLGPSGLQLLGTAFLTSVRGRFVTAAHTIGQDDSNLYLVVPQTKSLFDYQDTANSQVNTTKATVIAHDPFRDLCVLQSDLDTQSNLSVGGADDLLVGSEIASFGFPHSDFGRMVLTYQHAEVGAKVLIDASGIKSKHIIVNTQARPGQSGSPVFRLSDLRLVAVLIGSYAPSGRGGIIVGGIDPQTLHQTTHAISAEYITEMLKV
jgi:hypothetical protein